METMTPALRALDMMLEPLGDGLTPEAARALVALQIAPDVCSRVEALAELSSEGRLSEEERAEYAAYVEGAEILSLIKLKARRALSESGPMP